MNSVLNKKTRMEKFHNMRKSKVFNGTFWILGAGSIGTAIIYMLLHVFTITEKNIVIFDNLPYKKSYILSHYEGIYEIDALCGDTPGFDVIAIHWACIV